MGQGHLLKLFGDKTRGLGEGLPSLSLGFSAQGWVVPGFSGVRIPGLTCEELSLWGLSKWKPWLTGGDEAKSLFLPSKLAALQPQYSPGLFRG